MKIYKECPICNVKLKITSSSIRNCSVGCPIHFSQCISKVNKCLADTIFYIGIYRIYLDFDSNQTLIDGTSPTIILNSIVFNDDNFINIQNLEDKLNLLLTFQ